MINCSDAPYLTGEWTKKGRFDKSEHTIAELEMRWGGEIETNNNKVYFNIMFEDWKNKCGTLMGMELCKKEEEFIKSYLRVNDVRSEVEFWYGVFGELEDRLILKRKENVAVDMDYDDSSIYKNILT
jgi:hypothetical protein